MKKHVVGACFVLARKLTKGMAKKFEVQEKTRVKYSAYFSKFLLVFMNKMKER